MTSFQCASCGEIHAGLPMAWGPDAPKPVEAIPLPERHRRVKLTTDVCITDRHEHFVRACLDLRINTPASRWSERTSSQGA